MRTSRPVIDRYARWLARRALAIIVAGVVVLGAASYLVARHLPLEADFAYLLPEDAPAVRDLRRLAARLVARDTALVVVAAPEPASRAAATAMMADATRRLSRTLVERVDTDDAELRAFLRAHRHLLVPLAELRAVRDALARLIEARKLAANPLFVELDDDAPRDAAADLDELRARRAAAEARLERSGFVSVDGTVGLIVIRTAFSTTEVERGARLLRALARIRAEVRAAYPTVDIGFTGGVTTTVAEQSELAGGIARSILITSALVAALLLLHLRSVVLLGLLVSNLVVATAAAFGVAVFTVGHLNAATAFLGAIIAGNGVNFGILLIARYIEERRARPGDGPAPVEAVAAALRGTLAPTLVASLGAAIAYGSLAATSFRGFADFAAIGAVGMVLCWAASVSLLPAMLLRLGGRVPTAPTGGARLGRVLARVFGGARPRTVLVLAGVLAAVSAVAVVRYLARDPFEYDLKNLRSAGPAAAESRRWIAISDRYFGKSISGRAYIAADEPAQVPLIVDALRAVDRDLPPSRRAIGGVSSILDVVPPDQRARRAVLAELRALLDDPALAALSPEQQRELAALRPPDALPSITVDALPRELRDPLVERDGRIGLLIAVQPGPSLDQWNGVDLVRFASAVRTLRLADGQTISTSGSSVIFADILAAIERDGPIVTAVAALALVVLVVVVVGPNRHGSAVLASTGLGTLLMIATCAVLGLKVNFLDFIALPITLGLGVDYAINLGARTREAWSARAALRTSGPSVVVCSLTTIIGYGSLLVSDNLAIRGFGLASLIGEITCVLCALVLVPAIVRPRHSRRPTEVSLLQR